MIDKFMYVPNYHTEITPSVDYNYWLKHLDTQFNEPNNQTSTKVPKVVIQTNKKSLLKKTLGTCII